jgi:hypothetical protein
MLTIQDRVCLRIKPIVMVTIFRIGKRRWIEGRINIFYENILICIPSRVRSMLRSMPRVESIWYNMKGCLMTLQGRLRLECP